MAWNPFHRRSHERDPHLALVDTKETPTKRYVNLLLLHLIKGEETQITLHSGRALPHFGGFPEGPPPFASVENRLKVMSNLDPVTYHAPREGRIELIVNGDPFEVLTRFDDMGHAVTLRVVGGADEGTS